jgi:hypothetical protein
MYASYDCDGSLPFFDDVVTSKWVFPDGSYVEIEKNDRGYLVSGRFGKLKFCDNDGDDFFCEDADTLLNLLIKYDLHWRLQTNPS